ncbi:SHOCT domain-containing protein [Streptomyces sp. NBC_00878]|uniref:SHOCT domain-containing protein n=1 Tax=Streptomyces sp. NBC_00878 TaxID=2975854 RepID=UPI00224ED479|nr:SHOCT domain-containing protein [Streptomyces sp. NBC_00878]MCX4911029.1 SHOCT domain-containing protein [Streptomyces sp. NBC_00878]
MSGPTYLAYDYPLLSVFWSMLVFFLWIMWFVLLFRIVVDIFRDDAMSGWAKAGWLVFVILLPFVGVFVYVIARGKNMGRREAAQARAQQDAFASYVRETAKSGDGDGRPSSADELAKLSEIRGRGDITDDEFRRAKELVLSGHGPSERTGSTATSASGS